MQPKYEQRLVIPFLVVVLISFGSCAFGQMQPNKARLKAQALSDSGLFVPAAQKYAELHNYWNKEGVLDSAYYYKYKEMHHYGLGGANKKCTDQLQKLVSDFDKTGYYPRFSSQIYYTIGSNFLYQNEFDSALDFLDRSMTFEQNQPDADTIYIAKAMEWKGLTNIYVGDMAKAAELVEAAVALHIEALGRNHKELGYTLNSLALIYDEMNMLEKADSTFSEAYRILSLHLPPGHSHLSSVSANISSIKVELGDFDGARSMLESAIDIHREQNLLGPLLKEYFNLGALYLALDDTERGIPYVEKAMALADSILPVPHVDRANMYNGLGSAYFMRDKYRVADSLFRMGLRESLLLSDQQTAQLGQSYFNLGLIEASMENFEKAQEYYQKSYEIRKEKLGELHPATADAFYGIAEMKIALGNSDEGIAMLEACLGHYIDAYGYAHQSVIEASLFLSQLAYESNELAIGEKHLNNTWAYAFNLDPASFDFYKSDNIPFVDTYVLEVIDFHLKTMVKHKSSPQELLSVMGKMDDLMRNLWPLLNFENSRSEVLKQIRAIYHNSALIAHRLNAEKPDTTLQNIVMDALQKSRYATIRSAVQNRSAMQFANVPDSLVERDRLLRERLQFIRAKGAQGDAEYWRALEFEHMESWREFQKSMKKSYPDWYRLRYQDKQASLASAQKHLGNSSLLGYCYLDTITLAVVVNRNDFNSFEIASAGIAREVQHYRSLIEKQSSPQELAAAGYSLFQTLVEPVYSGLNESLMIMPDGPLHYINFESMPVTLPKTNDWREWDWMLKAHEIIAVNELPHFSAVNKTERTTLAFAPGFSEDTKSAYLDLLPEKEPADTLFNSWVRTPWSEGFAKELSDKGHSFLGMEAHKRNFREYSNTSGLLHFGTHAVMNDEEPLKSFLALTPRPDLGLDGRLYAHELYNQPISADLAVLTACETGVGAYSDGEGVLSLAYAFQYAGCPNVMYSLWKIDDQQSTEIARSFYENLNAGRNFSAALREAKLNYISRAPQELAAPYYWSGMVIAGSNGQLGDDDSSPFWQYALIAAALLAFAIGTARWVRLRV